MNASDIKNFVFNKSAVGGYKVSDVKGCLKEISEYVLSLEEKNFNLDRENKALKIKLSEVEKSQDEIKEIMISAQNFKHKYLKDAEEETQKLVSKAREKAEETILNAQEKAEETVSAAQEKAKQIEEKAAERAKQELDDLSKKFDSKKLQLEKIKREVSDFKVKLLEIYKAHLDLITKMPEVVESEISRPEIKDISSFEEKNSSILKGLQKNRLDDNLNIKNEVGENEENEFEAELSNFKKINRNMLNNEHIFKKDLDDDSDNFMEKIKNGNGNYIKSRFDELKR